MLYSSAPLTFILRAATLLAWLSLAVACTQSAKPGLPDSPLGGGARQARGTTPLPAAAIPRPPVSANPGVPGNQPSATPQLSGHLPLQGTKLQQELDSFVAGLAGTYGVVAYSFSTGEEIAINESELFPAASLYKLIVLYEAYRQVEAGEMSLTTPLQILPQHLVEADSSDLSGGEWLSLADALRLMTTFSSNAAAYAVLDEVGWQRFNDAAVELGLTETMIAMGNTVELQPEWRRDTASTSPRDMLRFFELLSRRQLVNASASDAMLGLLLDQQVNDRIPAGLPDSVLIAHKTGELDGVRNDAGIIFTESNTYILVVLSMGADTDEEVAAIAQIARLVQARFG